MINLSTTSNEFGGRTDFQQYSTLKQQTFCKKMTFTPNQIALHLLQSHSLEWLLTDLVIWYYFFISNSNDIIRHTFLKNTPPVAGCIATMSVLYKSGLVTTNLLYLWFERHFWDEFRHMKSTTQNVFQPRWLRWKSNISSEAAPKLDKTRCRVTAS